MYMRNKDSNSQIHIILFSHIWTLRDLFNNLKCNDKSDCFDNKVLDNVEHTLLINQTHSIKEHLHMNIYIFCQ